MLGVELFDWETKSKKRDENNGEGKKRQQMRLNIVHPCYY